MAVTAASVECAPEARSNKAGTAEPWTLQTLLVEMTARADDPALIRFYQGQPQRFTYAAIARDSGRLGRGLLQAGVTAGTPVAIWAPNGPDWVVVRLALGAIGALAVTIDDLATPEAAAEVLRDSGCLWVFASAAHIGICNQQLSKLAIFAMDQPTDQSGSVISWRNLLADADAPLPLVAPTDPTMLVYTSGTTGAPKSFTLTSANVWANLGPLRNENLIGPADRVLLPLPLHHVYPFVIGLLMPLISGATVVLPEAVGGPELMHAVRVGRVTAIVGVPRLYAAIVSGIEARVAARGAWYSWGFRFALASAIWLQRRLGLSVGSWLFRRLRLEFAPHLRLLVSGGARLDPDVAWKLEVLGWLILSGYGLAETASMLTGNVPRARRIGSEGRAIQRGLVRIASPDASGLGEIELKGPNVFSGYCNNPEATQRAFTADGWFRTGDLGRLDGDGFLTVTGRATELIVLGGGKHFFPDDLEAKYAASPFVEEIAVLEQAGSLVALVLPNYAAIHAAGRPAIEDALRVTLAEIGRDLPPFQRLGGLAIARAPLPRTRLGKYRRFLLPEIYRQARTGDVAAPPEDFSVEAAEFFAQPRAREIWEWLQQRYPGRRLRLDANPLLDLGIDSLERLSLALELEARFHVHLSEADLIEPQTLRALVGAVAAAAASAPPEGRPRRQPPVLSLPRPRGWASKLVAALAYAFNWALMRLVFRLRVVGAERLPLPGTYIVVANHVSYLDAPSLAAALPYRHMRKAFWGGDAALLFTIPLTGWLWRALNVMPVDERVPGESLGRIGAMLAAGNALLWFPEGWRSPTGELQHFQPGIGKIVAESGRITVPAFISGTFEALPRGQKLPRPHQIIVRFGHPLRFARNAEGEAEFSRIAQTLHDRVADLSPGIDGDQSAATTDSLSLPL